MTPTSTKPPVPGKPQDRSVESSGVHNSRFRTQMPQIPGVAQSAPGNRKSQKNVTWIVIVAGAVLLLGCFVVWRILDGSRGSRGATAQEQAPNPAAAELPPPPASSAPAASHNTNEIGTLAELSQPWTAKRFQYSHPLTRDSVAAIAIRLPVGNGRSSASYWGILLKAPYGQCELQFVTDLNQINAKYGYHATHPMVVDPCRSTVYDPLRTGTLPNGSWARGEIVQGSGFRPPMQIEIRIEGEKLVAGRSED
jgi:hypothetical protein